MSRPLRIEFPGAVYHITSRGNARQDIFLNDGDRSTFLSVLASVVEKYNWICHAYCLMDNHYHLLLETLDPNLSLGMRQLNGVYTQTFNKRQQRVGHVFQGRFKSILVEKESYLLELCRYIVLNPVVAGMVRHPDNYLWSSYGHCARGNMQSDFLTSSWILAQFDEKMDVARRKYCDFVAEGLSTKPEKPWEKLVGQFILGNESFVTQIKELLQPEKLCHEIPKEQRYSGRPTLAELFAEKDIDKKIRNSLVCTAHRSYGYTQKAIADHLGIHYTTVSRIVSVSLDKI
jgi:REP element-mobilizing transposase RayT